MSVGSLRKTQSALTNPLRYLATREPEPSFVVWPLFWWHWLEGVGLPDRSYDTGSH